VFPIPHKNQKASEDREQLLLLDLAPAPNKEERQRLLGARDELDGKECILILDTSTDPPRLILEKVDARITSLDLKGVGKAAARIGLVEKVVQPPQDNAEPTKKAKKEKQKPAKKEKPVKKEAKKEEDKVPVEAASAAAKPPPAPEQTCAPGLKLKFSVGKTPSPPSERESVTPPEPTTNIELQPRPQYAAKSLPATPPEPEPEPAPRSMYAAKFLPVSDAELEPESEPEEESQPEPPRPQYAAKSLPLIPSAFIAAQPPEPLPEQLPPGPRYSAKYYPPKKTVPPPPEIIEFSEASDSEDEEDKVATPLGSDLDLDLPSVIISAAATDTHGTISFQSPRGSNAHLTAPHHAPTPRSPPRRITTPAPALGTPDSNDSDFDLEALASDLDAELSDADSDADSVLRERGDMPGSRLRHSLRYEEDLDADSGSGGDESDMGMVGGKGVKRPMVGGKAVGKRPRTLGGDDDDEDEDSDY
jgi:hypothetical protein